MTSGNNLSLVLLLTIMIKSTFTGDKEKEVEVIKDKFKGPVDIIKPHHEAIPSTEELL